MFSRVNTPPGIGYDQSEGMPRMSQTTPEIDVECLERARSDGATVVDVREPGEYVAGHVPGSALMPMGQLASRLGELDKAGRCTSCAPRATAAPR